MRKYLATDQFLSDKHYSDDNEVFTDFRGHATTWDVLHRSNYIFWTYNPRTGDYEV